MKVWAVVPTLLLAFGAVAPREAARPSGRGPDTCYVMIFGEWSPPLHAAEGVRPGRSAWATWDSSAGDSALVVFPGWWPAGIAVRLDRGSDAESRTGRATAFVSDGRTTRPQATVRTRRVACGAPPPGASPR